MTSDLYQKAASKFVEAFGHPHTVAAYAPGRIEVLGNHTDYNEGFVLSVAIDCGAFFLAAPADSGTCRVLAADVQRAESFSATAPAPLPHRSWANYVIGVYAGLLELGAAPRAFDGLLCSNVPLGAGLSSSAALEIAAGLALARLCDLQPAPLDLARIGQSAEHKFAGVKCGLLDQISSIFGQPDALVMTDFRSLAVETVPLGHDAVFLMCRTHSKHALTDGAYNERRHHCEMAARHFAKVLNHPVRALRDVGWREWEQYRDGLDPVAAKRAAHVIGENERVQQGRACLARGDLAAFGKLMYASHESSRTYFENSCRELDAIVASAQAIPQVLGARLSGGGFGGSAVALVHPRDVAAATLALQQGYARRIDGPPCDIRPIRASAGARVLEVAVIA